MATTSADDPVRGARRVVLGILVAALWALMPPPDRWLAIIPLGYAVVMLVVSWRASAAHEQRSRVRRSLVLSGVVVAMLALRLGMPLALAPWTGDYRACMSGASTLTAQQRCAADHRTWATELLGEAALLS